jgi:hypothetical protein
MYVLYVPYMSNLCNNHLNKMRMIIYVLAEFVRGRVRCVSCGPSVRFSPNTETFPVTYVTVSGLAPLTAYTFQVYSENGVSKVSRQCLVAQRFKTLVILARKLPTPLPPLRVSLLRFCPFRETQIFIATRFFFSFIFLLSYI